jgi:hypothetical protein
MDDTSLITKPTNPTAPIPNKLILIESQSSSLPGFVASFSVFEAWDNHDRRSIFARTQDFNQE